MSQVLLIDDSSKISAINSLNLRIYTGVDVIYKHSSEDALKLLDIVKNFDVIITKAKIKEDEVAKKILLKIQEFDIPPTIICLGGDEVLEASKQVVCLSPIITHQELVAQVARLIGVTAKKMAALKLPDMYEIPIGYINFLSSVVCDIYLLTSEVTGGNSQFVEIASAGDDIQELKDNVSFYLKQGAKKFYIDTGDRIEFVNAYTQQVLAKLGQSDDLPEDQQIQATAAAMDAVSSDVVDNGFNETTIGLAKESINSLTKFAKEHTNTKIVKLLNTFLKQKVSYRYKRVQLTIMLIVESINNMDWGANEHVEKLSYVAFFHDILLYHDDMARIRTDEELENSDLNEKDKRIVRHHALWTLELLKDYPETHMGATVLIKQHHGSLNGIGFSDQPPSSISPLAIVFMVCEEYANEVLIMAEQEQEIVHNLVLKKLAARFPRAQYQKVIASLKNLSM